MFHWIETFYNPTRRHSTLGYLSPVDYETDGYGMITTPTPSVNPGPTPRRRIRNAVNASGTSLTDIFGVGPVIAAMLIGNSGSMSRFANRDRYAADNGTAPAEFSSGGRTVHRVSQRGNRTLNHALHLAAMIQHRQRHSEGRAYYERRVAEGTTGKEAVRALKRQLSNIIYRHLVADNIACTRRPGRTQGHDSSASVTGSHSYRPALRRSHSRTHFRTLRHRQPTPRRAISPALTQRGFGRG